VTSGIFISYRRDDTAGFAGRLYDRLAARYGDERVFMDIDTIRPGSDFASDIARALSDSAACIVLIGPQWPSIAKPDGSRRLLAKRLIRQIRPLEPAGVSSELPHVHDVSIGPTVPLQ
jgi:hypothetical protein